MHPGKLYAIQSTNRFFSNVTETDLIIKLVCTICFQFIYFLDLSLKFSFGLHLLILINNKQLQMNVSLAHKRFHLTK